MKPQMTVSGTYSSYLVRGPKLRTHARECSTIHRPNRAIIDSISPESEIRKRSLFYLLVLTPLSRPLPASALPGCNAHVFTCQAKIVHENGLEHLDLPQVSRKTLHQGERNRTSLLKNILKSRTGYWCVNVFVDLLFVWL